MYAPFARPSSFIALALVATTGFAARGVLRADGILRVKGADLSNTSITVVPEGAASYSLPIGTKHFTLQLPLDDIYLVSVQREGCPTKEIYVDTRVPAENHAADFQFPFMVTLEHMSPELLFAYAGPVGFVRYMAPLQDFGYETDYLVRVNEDLRHRMDAVRETGVDPKVMLPVMSALVVDLPSGAYSAPSGRPMEAQFGTLAPIASEVPAMVHVVTAVAAVRVVPTVTPSPKAIALERVSEVPLVAPVRAAALPMVVRSRDIAPRSDFVRAIPIAQVIEPKVSMNEAVILARPTVAAIWTTTRTEETIVEPRRLTRIVRFSTPTTDLIEFRKVTHAYGAVYFFNGSVSITERAFDAATAQVLAGAF